MLGISEVAQHFDYIGVVEETLNLQLSDELGQHIVLQDSTFRDRFQGNDHPSTYLSALRVSLPSETHSAELSFS